MRIFGASRKDGYDEVTLKLGSGGNTTAIITNHYNFHITPLHMLVHTSTTVSLPVCLIIEFVHIYI